MISSIEQQLARDEGRRLVMYPDDKGWMTNGIGHWLGTKVPDEVPEHLRVISNQTCDQLFNLDFLHEKSLLKIYIPWWAVDGEFGPRAGVILNAAFNLGTQKLATFKGFLGFYRARDWQAAADDLATTLVFKQLPVRYGRLRKQIITGQWQ